MPVERTDREERGRGAPRIGAAITEVAAAPRAAASVLVRVDGVYVGPIRALDAADLRLAAGMIWTAELQARCEVSAARVSAERYLGQRGRVLSARLREYLLRRGHGEAAVREVLDQLREAGVLDDAAQGYAQASGGLAANKSRNLLEYELTAGGLGVRGAERLVRDAETESGRTEEARARALAERKLRGVLKDKPPQVQRRRLLAALARHGFDELMCQETIDRLLSADSGWTEDAGPAHD